ncbi:MAG: M23 family metallopeptidase [bacterium]|nr:M23 family metallopeptidase [bacterium]
MVKWIIIQIMVCLLGPVLASAQEGYAWPMKAKPALTSTFGEYRQGGRLHAAIDLKTWGKEGFPVVAVDDGYVWRVRTSPWGFGRAVYIKLRDGRFAVYAHLSGFSEQIKPFVEAEQERRETYSVNMFFQEGQIPVRRGETVGFSGSTGIGVPHMHFEIRDAKNRPMNPLKQGFGVVDTHPPTLKSVALIPLDADSRVRGSHEPYVVGVRWMREQGHYQAAQTIPIEGRVGVALNAFDRADASLLTNRLAPYWIQLSVDNREVFRTTYSVFDFYTTGHGELDRNFVLGQRGLGRFHNLYREAGNRLPFYEAYEPGDGILHAGVPIRGGGVNLAAGTRMLRIAAEDANGNRAEAILEVLVNHLPEVLEATAQEVADSVWVVARVVDDDPVQVIFEWSEDQGENWQRVHHVRLGKSGRVQSVLPKGKDRIYRVLARDPHGQEAFGTCAPVKANGGTDLELKLVCSPVFYSDFAVVKIQSEHLLAAAPRTIARWPGGREERVPVRQIELKRYEAVVRFDKAWSGEIAVSVSAVNPSGALGHQSLVLVQQRVDPTQGGVIRSEDGLATARFDRDGVYQTLFGRVEKTDATDVLQVYQFMPNDVAFQSAEIALGYPETFDRPEKLGVYRKKKEKWEFLDNRLDRDGRTLSAKVKHFSTYALLLDEVPPVVRGLVPRSGGTVQERRPQLMATIRDSISGIGRETDISMTLDGKTMIFEYDPEEDRIVSRPKNPLGSGQHVLRVVVKDMCGNETVRESLFGVR